MSDKTEKEEATIEEIAKSELPEPLTSSEKATFEARIAELETENEELKTELGKALEAAPEHTTDFEKMTPFNLEDYIPKLF